MVGTSESYSGAGVAAANLNSGPDLVLDGSVDGEPDAQLWEWGLGRASATDWSFQFFNSGAGRLNLTVDGDMTSDVVRTEEVVVNGMTVIDDSGDWLGNGSTVPCPSCVTSSDIADGTIIDNDLANGSVTGAKILDGTITEADISPAAALDADTLGGQDAAYYQRRVVVERSSSSNVVYLTDTCASYVTRTVQTDGPGTVVLTGEAYFSIDASATYEQPWLAIADGAGVCDDHVRWVAGPSSDDRGEQLSLTRVFTIPSAGTYYFHLNSKMHLGYGPSTDLITERSLLAVFYPD